MTADRRHFLGLATLVAFSLGAARLSAEEIATCASGLTLSQKSRRRALGYIDSSGDATRHCGLCNFFTTASAGCGNCALLGGGPVSAGGVCGSFAARAAKPG